MALFSCFESKEIKPSTPSLFNPFFNMLTDILSVVLIFNLNPDFLLSIFVFTKASEFSLHFPNKQVLFIYLSLLVLSDSCLRSFFPLSIFLYLPCELKRYGGHMDLSLTGTTHLMTNHLAIVQSYDGPTKSYLGPSSRVPKAAHTPVVTWLHFMCLATISPLCLFAVP